MSRAYIIQIGLDLTHFYISIHMYPNNMFGQMITLLIITITILLLMI